MRRSVVLGPPALVALVALVAVLVAAGGAPGPTAAGLADAGPAIRWSVPVARVLLDLCAIVTVGGLVLGVVLAPPRPECEAGRGPDEGRRTAARALRSAAGWAAAWTATTLSAATLTASEVTGVPLARLSPSELTAAVWGLPPTRALLLVALLTSTVAVAAAIAGGAPARRRAVAAGALAVAVVALTPPLYTGHAAHAGNHELATGSLVVHVVAATIWLGGLVGLVLHLRATDPALGPAVERFSTVALGCFGALTATGLLAAFAALGTSGESWASPYAAVVVAKVAAAAALGLFGWAHRRRTIDRLRAGQPRSFLRLAAVELTVMGATVGTAVALSRSPGATGSGFLGRATRAVGPGEATPSVSLVGLVGDWRPDPVLSTAVVIALVAYLRAVRRATASGHPWPAHRTWFAVGAAALAVGAAGVPTSYDARPLLAVQAGQFAAFALGVVALADAARIGELRDLGRGPTAPHPSSRWWADLTSDPTTGVVALVAVGIGVLLSPVHALTATSAPARVAVLACSLAAGAVCWSSLRVAGRRHPARSTGSTAGVSSAGSSETAESGETGAK